MIKEAEFALKQAFAFCPYSPEAVFNYSQLLATIGRYDDALAVAKTCEIFDADNLGIRNLVEQLEAIQKGASPTANAQTKARASGPNAEAKAVFDLASAYFSAGQSNQAVDALEVLLTNSSTKPEVFLSLVRGTDSECSNWDVSDAIALPQVARDGLVMPRPADGQGWPYAPEQVFMSPGYRIEALLGIVGLQHEDQPVDDRGLVEIGTHGDAQCRRIVEQLVVDVA
jgi:tetratricopeptide (TPR) repeat protein